MDGRNEDYYKEDYYVEDESCEADNEYCEGDDEYCEAEEEDQEQLPSSTRSSCKVITKESLYAAQREDLERVMELLSLKERHARTFLIHYQWDVDKVCDKYFNQKKEDIYAEACIMIQEDHDISLLNLSSEVLCEMCMEKVSFHNMITMDCNHSFCNICWTKYFVEKINESETRLINCMSHNCYIICDEEKIRTLVKENNPVLVEKFDRFLLESYIEDNEKVKWCPSIPHCGNAIRIDDGDIYCEVECACGFQFCFSCSSEPHSPCSCRMLELWKERSRVSNWDFSWNTQYYNRFNAYKDSHEEKIRLKEGMHSYLPTMVQPTNSSSATESHVDYCWVSNVIDRFFISRRVLSNSYVFAYYMFIDALFSNQITIEDKENKKNLLEGHQKQLNMYLEEISFLLHQPLYYSSGEKFKESKVQILTLSSLLDGICKKLFEFIDKELPDQNQFGMKIYSIAPYNSNGAEKAVEINH